MIKKGDWLYTIGILKCPRCHEGDLFETPTFSFKKPFDMPDKCPHCGQKYVLETGFYFGAMFISYIITAFLMFGLFGIVKFLLGFDVLTSFIAITVVIFLLFVWLFRVSRAVWLSFFVKYNPNINSKNK
jgi:uncharacterized protein (DUF983 family)